MWEGRDTGAKQNKKALTLRDGHVGKLRQQEDLLKNHAGAVNEVIVAQVKGAKVPGGDLVLEDYSTFSIRKKMSICVRVMCRRRMGVARAFLSYVRRQSPIFWTGRNNDRISVDVHDGFSESKKKRNLVSVENFHEIDLIQQKNE